MCSEELERQGQKEEKDGPFLRAKISLKFSKNTIYGNSALEETKEKEKKKKNCGVSGSDGLKNLEGATRSYTECRGTAVLGTLALEKRVSYPVHSLYLCSNPSSKIPISLSNLSIHLPVYSCPFKSSLLSFANNTVAVPAL